MKLFRYLDRLIVAIDEADARSLLRDHYGPLKRGAVRQQRRSVLLSTDNGETLQSYTPTEAVEAGGRGLIPHY